MTGRTRALEYAAVCVVLLLCGLPLACAENDVEYSFARKVAQRYAEARWSGSRVGKGELCYSPDGSPEVYSFLVFKTNTVQRTTARISARLHQVRERRGASVGSADAEEVRSAWRDMAAPEQYGTVVIGAHEGREPFIACFSGLPPQILFKPDAVEMRKSEMGAHEPGQPRCIWSPPAFWAFQFPDADKKTGEAVLLQVRGTRLLSRKIEPARESYEGAPLTEAASGVVAGRRAKWDGLRRALDEK